MRSIYKKLINFWFLLCCVSILGWRCLAVIFSSLRNNVNHREFVNRFAKTGAREMLNTLKTDYGIEFAKPFMFEENSSYIFMSNHQSLFDIPLIYATVPGTIRFVTKSELFRIPLFGRALQVGECVRVYRKDPSKKQDFINDAKEKLMKGVSLWVFPEGTRSLTANLLPFKSGGFHLALETCTKIVPAAIINTLSIMPPKKFKIARHQKVKIRLGEPIDPSTFKGTPQELIEKVRATIQSLMS